jgi:dTMP kinase
MMLFRMGNKGLLIVFEGIDGSGKTTQAKTLLRGLRARGIAAVFFREPTGGRWGREIRRKAIRRDSLTPGEELELFVKDRREDVAKNLGPALAAGNVVVLDRYYLSTIAYQGAKGLDPGRILRMNETFAPKPDLVFILDVEAGTGLSRIGDRKRKEELFEREDYLDKVRELFNGFRGRKIIHIDGTGDRKTISAVILEKVLQVLDG